MAVEATLSFQNLHRKLKRLDKRHKNALLAATQQLIEIITEEHMSGPTTPTSVSIRSGDLKESVRPRGSGIRTVNRRYYYGSIHFGMHYAGAHISPHYRDNPNLPYGTRVHWRDIIDANPRRIQEAFNRAWGTGSFSSAPRRFSGFSSGRGRSVL